MRSSQGKKCFVMIHFILLKLSPTVLLLNTLIRKYMWEKITVLHVSSASNEEKKLVSLAKLPNV